MALTNLKKPVDELQEACMAQISSAKEKVHGTWVVFSASTSAEKSNGWGPTLLGDATITGNSPNGDCLCYAAVWFLQATVLLQQTANQLWQARSRLQQTTSHLYRLTDRQNEWSPTAYWQALRAEKEKMRDCHSWNRWATVP